MPVRRAYVEDLYRNTLGRGDNFTPQEVEGWLNAPDEQSVLNAFLGSPEYTSKHGGTATWQDVGGVITPTDPQQASSGYGDVSGKLPIDSGAGDGSSSGGGSAAAPGSMLSFIPGRYDYSAFDTARPQDVRASAKDAFAAATSNAPPAPFGDKQALAQWFNQYVRPAFEAQGHKVLSVGEDGFTYTNHEGTFYVDYAQNAGAAPGTMLQRFQWNATPADAATAARYPSSGASGSSAVQRTVNGIGNLYSQLGLQYGGPGGPGVFNGPLQQVGQDPLSQLITGGLADLILNQGMTRSGQDVMGTLRSIIDSGGQLSPDARNRRFESARELMAKGERTALNDAQASLANRGLLSEPGNPSGAESSTIGRIQTRNAEEFARALRDIGIAEDDAANTRLSTALGLAVGMSTDQARTLLATLGAGTDRQNMLAQVALESLSQNMAWSQFLAQFGLQRDQVMYQIQNGNIDQILPYLAMFLQLAQSTQRGYI